MERIKGKETKWKETDVKRIRHKWKLAALNLH